MPIKFNLSQNDFFNDYQEKKPLILKGAFNVNFIDWFDINGILERSDVTNDDFKLLNNGLISKDKYIEPYQDVGMLRYRLIIPFFYDKLKSGATVVANKIKNERKIDDIARVISQFTNRQVVNSLYVSFGDKDSFRNHWDTRDVFVVQIKGRKRWVIYKPTFEFPLYTQQSKDIESLYPCSDEPYDDFILNAGDILYLPRGWWHNPSPIGEETVHLSIGTFPPYSIDYINWVFNKLPDYIEARESLSSWENDSERLQQLMQKIKEFVDSPSSYQDFMDDFHSMQRLSPLLAIDKLINSDGTTFSGEERIFINAIKIRDIDSGYIICNGGRIVLDNTGLQVIKRIIETPGITLSKLVGSCPINIDPEKIKKLIYELCYQDVLSLQ